MIALITFEWVVLAYFLVVNSFYAMLLVSAAVQLRQHRRRVWQESIWRVLSSDLSPSITVIAPAYNESATIIESVRSLLTLYYPSVEIVVVNDGSSDDTLGILAKEFRLSPMDPIYDEIIPTSPVIGTYVSQDHPELIVLDKENGGKADALNAGLSLASGELVCAIDADTIIEPDALQRMVRPFLLDDGVLAAGGTIRLANSARIQRGRVIVARTPRRAIPGFQVVEYLRAFLFGRLGWNALGGNLIISGAFGLFRKESLVAAGGYAHDTVGEDMELVVRLRRHAIERGEPGKVAFVPDPVAWTEAPESLRVLGRQRDRWHRGLCDTMWSHRKILFNPRFGRMGLIAYPYFVVLELFAPVVELLGLAGLVAAFAFGAVDVEFAVLFFLAAYAYGLVLTVCTLLLEEFGYNRYEGIGDRFFLLLWAVLENIGYRQLTVLWRLQGMAKYLRGRSEWGNMERRGFGAE